LVVPTGVFGTPRFILAQNITCRYGANTTQTNTE